MLSPTDLLILQTLRIQKAYGYELKQRLPAISLSTLYHSLHKLTAQGLCLQQQAHNQKGPVRSYYSLTARARRFLQHQQQQELIRHEEKLAEWLEHYHILRNKLHHFRHLSSGSRKR